MQVVHRVEREVEHDDMPDRMVPKVQAAGSQVGADQQLRGLTSAVATPGAELRHDLATLPRGHVTMQAERGKAKLGEVVLAGPA